MTTPPVYFADTTTLVRSILVDGLPGEGYASMSVTSRVPNPRPTQFVRVFRTGGPRLNLVADNAQITVEAWAATDPAAHDLLQTCRTLIHAARRSVVDGTALYGVQELAGPGWLPDPTSDQPRWSMTFTVATRGVSSL